MEVVVELEEEVENNLTLALPLNPNPNICFNLYLCMYGLLLVSGPLLLLVPEESGIQ